jgi:hypothetical protein
MNHRTDDTPKKSFLREILVGIVVGIAVLVGQYFIQPRITEQETIRNFRLDEKRESYFQAITLVDQLWGSITWEKDGKASPAKKTIPPSANVVNDCAAKLYLVSNDKEVPIAFMSLFQHSMTNNQLDSGDRIKFFQLLEKDLFGKETSGVDADNLPFMVELPNTNAPILVAPQ